MSMHSDEVTLLTAAELVAEGGRLEFEAPLPTIDHVIGNPAPAFTLEEATFATAASVLPVPPPSLTALHLTSPLAFALAFAPTNVAKVCVEHASLAPAPSDPARNPGRSTRVRRPPNRPSASRRRPPRPQPLRRRRSSRRTWWGWSCRCVGWRCSPRRRPLPSFASLLTFAPPQRR